MQNKNIDIKNQDSVEKVKISSSAKLSDKQLDKLADISEKDITNAVTDWNKTSSDLFKNLLDAK